MSWVVGGEVALKLMGHLSSLYPPYFLTPCSMALLAAFQGPPNPIYFVTLVSQEHLGELGGMGEMALELMDHLSALCSIH